MKKLAIVTTHPIQYNAPLFALLAKRKKIHIKIFYTWGEAVLENKYDPGFTKTVEWDIPLLEGYEYSFVDNIAAHPGSHHFKGIDNPTLIKEIELWNADAIWVYGWSYKSHLKAIRYFKNKIPVYFRGDSTILGRSNILKNIIKKVVFKYIYQYIDVALYVGTNNKAYYLKYGLKEKQLVFAPHAVDNNRFSKISPKEENDILRLKNKIGIEKYKMVFLFVGKLEEKKNVSLLLDTFCKVNNPSIGLLIVGNGILKRDYKNNFKNYNNIHFLDFQNQSIMPVVYRLGDIVVLPSKGTSETWGLAINEAMASGRAILASSDCGAAIDLVKDGENGYIFKSEDCKDLELKIQLFINQENNLSALGAASQKIIENWSLDKICEVIEKELNKEEGI